MSGIQYGYKNNHGRFDIVLIDFPLPYNARLRGEGRTKFGEGATGHYNTMTETDLFELMQYIEDVLADKAVIFPWSTGPRLPLVLDLMRTMKNVQYATKAFSWFKTTRDNMDFRQLPGSYTASNTEDVLLFTHTKRKGETKLRPATSGGQNLVQQVIFENGACEAWPDGTEAIVHPLMAHSRKPDTVHERIDMMYPGLRKLELFARRQYPGWVCLGNEITGNDIITDLELAAGGYYDLAQKEEELVG